MMKFDRKKRYNIAVRGGESDSFGYFAPMKEWDKKGIKHKNAFLVSGGIIQVGTWANGYDTRETKILLKKIKCDRTMRAEAKLENDKKQGVLFKALSAVGIIAIVKTVWSASTKKLLEKNTSWERIKKAGKIEKVYIGFTTREEIKKCFPWFMPFPLMMAKLLSKAAPRELCEKVFKNVGIFWASNDGIYKTDTKNKKLVKCSNDIIPYATAARAGIKNPVMNNFTIRIKGKKQRPVDLGVIHNHGTMGYLGKKNNSFILFSCLPLPDEYMQGDSNVSDFIYNQFKPTHAFVTPPARDDGFFSFNDKKIEFEYNNSVATDFYK